MNFDLPTRNLLIGHLLFWLGYFGLMVGFGSNFYAFDQFWYRLMPAIAFQAAFAYLNIGLLIPRLLKRKRYWLYLLAAVALIVILLELRFQFIDELLPEPPRPGRGQGPGRGLGRGMDRPDMSWRRYGGRFFGMLTIWGFSTGYALFQDWLTSQQTRARLTQQQLATELKFLKNQINPHFLFNTLNNLYTLTYMKDERAAPMVLKLSEMMRYMLKQSPEERVALEDEISFLHNFIELQKLKTDKERELDFQTQGIKAEHRIAPLLLLNLFENSFKHGDWEKNPQGWIRANLQVDESDKLHFSLHNSTRPSEPLPVQKGIGLKNVERQLSLLYPQRHQLQIAHRGDRFEVELEVELGE
jgi:two-component system LytT family sensor kinase